MTFAAASIVSRPLMMIPPAMVVMGPNVTPRIPVAAPFHVVPRVVGLIMLRTALPMMLRPMVSVIPAVLVCRPMMTDAMMRPPTVAGVMNHGGGSTDVNAAVIDQRTAENRRTDSDRDPFPPMLLLGTRP